MSLSITKKSIIFHTVMQACTLTIPKRFYTRLIYMQNKAISLTAEEVRKAVIDHIVSYLMQCRIPADFINPRLVFLAAEESYRPQKVFWRALTRDTILEALETYAPSFRNSLTFVEEDAYETLIDRIDFMLAIRTSDELNAEILLSVPEDKRPSTSTKALEFLVYELIERGNYNEAGYLIRDAEKGLSAAFELAAAQLAAQEGRTYETEFAKEATETRHAFAITLPFETEID